MNSETFYINHSKKKLSSTITDSILRNSDAYQFHKSLEGYKPTPLISLQKLAQHFNVNDIYVKDESHRFGLNAFKVLGASYAIYKSISEHPNTTIFCTATDGNHGKAVAWSAKLFGKQSYVFVPNGTTKDRIKAIENEGANVEIFNGNYDKTCEHAKEMSAKNDWVLIQDTAWENYERIPAQIMAGYLSIFLEMEQSINKIKKTKS